MAAENSVAAQPEERVLVITRIFDAPRHLVWKAWTEPERMVRWLGPRGFTTTVLRRTFARAAIIAFTCARRRAPSIGSKVSIASLSSRSDWSPPMRGRTRRANPLVRKRC